MLFQKMLYWSFMKNIKKLMRHIFCNWQILYCHKKCKENKIATWRLCEIKVTTYSRLFRHLFSFFFVDIIMCKKWQKGKRTRCKDSTFLLFINDKKIYLVFASRIIYDHFRVATAVYYHSQKNLLWNLFNNKR